MNSLYLLFAACTTVLYLFSVNTDPTGTFRAADAVFLIAPYFALLMGVYAIAYFGGGNRRSVALLWLTLGILCYVAGETVWFYLVQIQHVLPSPSLADILFLLVYPCFLAGMFIEFRLSKVKITAKTFHKPFFYVLLLAMAAIAYFGIYGAYATDSGSLENIIAMSYGIGDLLLVASIGLLLLVLAEYDSGKIHLPWRSIGLGFLFTLAGDLGLAFFGEEAYSASLQLKIPIELAWMFGYFLFALGMLQFALIAKRAQSEARRQLLLMQVSAARTTKEAAATLSRLSKKPKVRKAVVARTKKQASSL